MSYFWLNVRRFLWGCAGVVIVPVLMLIMAAIYLGFIVEGVAVIMTAVCGLVWLCSRDPVFLDMFWRFGIWATVGMGLTVLFWHLVIDAILASIRSFRAGPRVSRA